MELLFFIIKNYSFTFIIKTAFKDLSNFLIIEFWNPAIKVCLSIQQTHKHL